MEPASNTVLDEGDSVTSSEDEIPMLPLPKAWKLGVANGSDAAPNDEVPAATGTPGPPQDFTALLARAIPAQMVHPELRRFLVAHSNERLTIAEEDGATLADVCIGDDGLPAWHAMYWDPEVESLHAAVQDRLRGLQLAHEVGGLVRREMVRKGNRALTELRAAGVDISDVFVGDNLLPQVGGDGDGDEAMSDASFASARDGDMTFPTPPVSESGVSLGVGSGSGSESESESDFDDAITLNNFVADDAQYSEAPYEDAHVAHGVQLVGGPGGTQEADVEVYVANNDDDVAQLPEVELAIDGAAFEHHFGADGVVDVEMPGVDVVCNGEVDGSDSEEEPEEAVLMRHRISAPAAEQRGISAGPVAASTPTGGNARRVSYESDVSEEVTDDGDGDGDAAMGANIVDTEEGFRW